MDFELSEEQHKFRQEVRGFLEEELKQEFRGLHAKMDVKDMDLKSLKALAYDKLSQIEAIRNNLQIINQEIMKRMQKDTDLQAKKSE